SPLWFLGGVFGAVCLVGLLLLLERPPQSLPPRVSTPVATHAAQPYVAVLVALDGVQWKPGTGSKLVEGSPIQAGPLALRAGRLTLTFFNGVMLSLEGPVELNVLSY